MSDEYDILEAEIVEEPKKAFPWDNSDPDRKKTFSTTELGLLSPSQAKFAALVAEGGGLSDSYRKAFPGAKESKHVHKYANMLIKNPKVRQQVELLQQAARMKFLMDAPRAAEKMIDLSINSKSDKVQLEATKDILNRAGLQPPQRVETIHVGIFGSASQQDIRNLLRKQIEEAKEDEE
jgi:hypothetical protein